MKVIRHLPDEGWVPVSNAAARDHRLSWRARGLLLELLSYPDGWDTTIDKLVKQARAEGEATEGREAMLRAMKELETVGYVHYIRDRHKAESGRWIWTTGIVVSDVPLTVPTDIRLSGVSEDPTDIRVSGRSEFRCVGNLGSYKEDGHEHGQEDVLSSPAAARARGRDDDQVLDDGEADPWAAGAVDGEDPGTDEGGRTNWRREDRALFARLIDAESLYVDGTRWHVDGTDGKAGPVSVIGHYNGLRKMKDAKRYPGRWLQAIHDADPEKGIDDWLADNGIRRVTAGAPGPTEEQRRLQSLYAAVDRMTFGQQRARLDAMQDRRPFIFDMCQQKAVDHLMRRDPAAVDSTTAVARLTLMYALQHYAGNAQIPTWLRPDS
ncbi:MAG TPA: hypothetical protein VJT31_04635 [Rugosimonospora sp.]|nr:hypothetical protein [Rugosimonospora sp.]